jgi:uncharacterized LabA/DUF88 family protein
MLINDPYTGAPEHHYLFVDGGYLRKLTDDFIGKLFDIKDPECFLDFSRIKGAHIRRAFYYDCFEDQRLMDYFNKINSTRGFHARRGSLVGLGKRKRQKQVDVMLAVDMLTYGLTKTMTVATLLSGDADFIPVIKALVRHGTYTNVVCEHGSTAKKLYRNADAQN